MAQIIDGKKLSKEILKQLKIEVANLSVRPGFAAILVGDNAASELYVRLKEKACKDLGIHFEKHVYPSDADQKNVIQKIQDLNSDDHIHAMLIQLPLPKQLDTQTVINSMNPHKDVDGFHPQNIERFMAGTPPYTRPVLIRAIIRLIEATSVPLRDKRAVILGNSDIFMRPLGSALLRREAQVMWQTTDTNDWKEHTRAADVLISALGKPHFIKKEDIKKGAIVIDVGITKDDSRVRGDVDPECEKVAKWMTPVPGGVGPMTIAMLMTNIVEMAKLTTNK